MKKKKEKKNGQDLNFPMEDIQMADRHRKQCSKSIVINKMKFATTVRCYTCIRMATKKRPSHTKCWQTLWKKLVPGKLGVGV